MILSGRDLAEAAAAALEPGPCHTDEQLSSVDVHVDEAVCIQPGDFAVVPTVEHISMPASITAQVTGRSSHMRDGVFMPGGYVDPGYRSGDDKPFVLEFFNMSDEDFELERGEPGARLTFMDLSETTAGYAGKWHVYSK